jgi:hypothetical protein
MRLVSLSVMLLLGVLFISHNTYPHARLLQVRALIALARRGVNVLWAMLRDGTTFESRYAA